MPMNTAKVTLGIVIVLALAAVVYERNKSIELQSALQSLGKDRDTLEQQVESLTRLMQEAKGRDAKAIAAAASVPAPRVAIPLAATLRPEEPAVPGVTTKPPAGWGKNGSKPDSYVVGVDQNQGFNGQPSAYIKSLDSSVEGFGGMMQTISAEEYVGQRVRLSGWMKTEEANQGGGHLWMRVDGQQVGASLQLDNMNNRAPKGTTDWQSYSVVLDVPAGAGALAYGAFMQGGGKMWINGTKIEPVGPEVPSTNMLTNRAKALPKAPVNLGFVP